MPKYNVEITLRHPSMLTPIIGSEERSALTAAYAAHNVLADMLEDNDLENGTTIHIKVEPA